MNRTASLLKLSGASNNALDIKSITLNYTCNPSGSQSEHELMSLSLTGGRSYFDLNEEFAFTGKITATYNDGTTSVVTDDVTYAKPDMATAGEKTVTFSYTEGGITKTVDYTFRCAVRGITYAQWNTSYDEISGAIDEEKSSLPTYAAYGETVNLAITPVEAYGLLGAFDEEGELELEMDDGKTSFSMPNRDVKIILMFGQALERIEVASDAPKTQTLGSAFSMPTIYGYFYDDSTKQDVTEFATADSSDYDMSKIGDYDVTIAVEYLGKTLTATYSFSVVDGGGEEEYTLSGTYVLTYNIGSSGLYHYYYILVLNDDGTGAYKRKTYNASYSGEIEEYREFKYSGGIKSFTLELTKHTATAPTNYRLFSSTTVGAKNDTGSLNGDGNLSITLYTSSGTASTVEGLFVRGNEPTA